MKFGKLIQRIREELPDAHFLKYKELKKMLKLVKSSESGEGREERVCLEGTQCDFGVFGVVAVGGDGGSSV